MNEITIKLHKESLEKIKPLISALAEQGNSPGYIAGCIKKYIERKKLEFYAQQESKSMEISTISTDILKKIEGERNDTKGNKTEYIFYEILEINNIPFDFQYKIGPYRADYLIAGFIVFEGDGPHHDQQKEYDNKRDKYLRKMGYTVVRMPWELIAQVQNELIIEIKNLIEREK